MGVLIVLVIILAVIELSKLFVLFNIEKWLATLCELEPEQKPEESKVSDPYVKQKELYSSTNHIIVPKTPTEIRNQNFNKLKEGIEYGDIAKR